MRRSVPGMLSVLGILAATTVVLSPSVPAAVAAPDHCTRGDAQAIAEAGYQFGGRLLGGQPHGAPAASTRKWADCQFRLYDDNDDDNPEVAHAFSEDDWIVGAISYFLYYSEFPLVGETRADATAYLDTWTEHFYFGPASLPDANLPEVSLTKTAYRNMQLPGLGERTVWNHTYAIWPAGSLAPGTYRFRFEQLIPDGPFAGQFEARGTLMITDVP